MARAENHLRLNPLVLGPYNSVVHNAIAIGKCQKDTINNATWE